MGGTWIHRYGIHPAEVVDVHPWPKWGSKWTFLVKKMLLLVFCQKNRSDFFSDNHSESSEAPLEASRARFLLSPKGLATRTGIHSYPWFWLPTEGMPIHNLYGGSWKQMSSHHLPEVVPSRNRSI